MKKLIALLLAVAFVFAVAVGCSNNNPGKTDDTTGGKNTGDDTTAPAVKPWYDGLNFDGEDIVVGVQGGYYDDYIFGIEGGDIAWASIYEANETVPGSLGLKLEINTYTDSQSQSILDMFNEIQKGDCPDDVVLPDQYFGVCYVVNNAYQNVRALDTENNWLNLNADCWYKDYHKNLAADSDKALYFLAGDLSPTILAWCACSFVNIDLYNNIFGDDEAINDFLDLVEEGKWTIEQCAELCKKAFVDLNSNQKVDLEDQLGASTSQGQSASFAALAAGMVFSRKVGDAYEIDCATERNNDIYKKIYELYTKTEGFLTYDYGVTPDGNIDTFVDGRQLMMNEYFLYAFRPQIRDMEDSYVIVPRPKADEQQEKYLSSMQDGLKLYSIPATAPASKLEAITAYLQRSCEVYNEKVIPAMYETSLKIKYASEKIDPDQVSRLIDLVRSGIYSDFAAVYNHALNNIVDLVGGLTMSKAPDWNARISIQLGQYKTRLKTLLDGFAALK